MYAHSNVCIIVYAHYNVMKIYKLAVWIVDKEIKVVVWEK